MRCVTSKRTRFQPAGSLGVNTRLLAAGTSSPWLTGAPSGYIHDPAPEPLWPGSLMTLRGLVDDFVEGARRFVTETVPETIDRVRENTELALPGSSGSALRRRQTFLGVAPLLPR